MLKVSRQLKI